MNKVELRKKKEWEVFYPRMKLKNLGCKETEENLIYGWNWLFTVREAPDKAGWYLRYPKTDPELKQSGGKQ